MIHSQSVRIAPLDHRCRYWALIIRKGEFLPLPIDVKSANDVSKNYLPRGEEELLPGDVLFEGQANHHRSSRGWSYWMNTLTREGEMLFFESGKLSEQKAQMKKQGMSPELLKGSGDIAALVRIMHGLRAGMTVTESPE